MAFRLKNWGRRAQFRKVARIGISLAVLWLILCLPMQGAQVRSLVWEHTTCHGATKPKFHHY